MVKYLKNLDNICPLYRVNEFVLFNHDWFDYLMSSPLPWYYRIVPVVVEYFELYDISVLMDRLSKDFSLVILHKYLNSHQLSLIIVTDKSLYSINDILNSYKDVKFVYLKGGMNDMRYRRRRRNRRRGSRRYRISRGGIRL